MRRLATSLALAVAVSVAGCADGNPYGPPYLTTDLRIPGSYAPAERPRLPVPPVAGPGDVGLRLTLGSSGEFTGWFTVVGAVTTSQQGLSGTWDFSGSEVVIRFDPIVASLPESVVLEAAFFENRVDLSGQFQINERLVSVLLTKPRGRSGIGGGGFS